MKTGIIIYVAGSDHEKPVSDFQSMVKKLKLNADKVEVVSRSSGHFDVSDAWWSLTARGMHRILLMMAQFTIGGDLQLTGRILQLSG